jgi:hypothetical protein
MKRALLLLLPVKQKSYSGPKPQGAVAEGVDNVEGARDAEGVIEEQAPEGVAVLDGVIGAERGVKEVFIFTVWQPCNSFSANIASWNKRLTILYSL